MRKKQPDLREELATSLLRLGTPIDWVDVGFAIVESAAIQGVEEAKAYREVKHLLREGYIKAAQLMEGPPAV